jgi:decaprenylphospho-beta-D-erythro-pentofuranosid-2-ulose 2-reductase
VKEAARIGHVVIVGAGSLIATHCARLWLARGTAALTLIGRDPATLERLAADLRVRAPRCAVETLAGDLLEPRESARLADAACRRGPPDVVLIAHGMLPDQAACQADAALAAQALAINAVSPACFAECFARHLAGAGRGTLAIIGSVAGDRGRASNYVYGAAKGLLDRYAQGLQHRFARSSVRVVLLKPGPTDTPMTAHLRARGAALAPVERVARAAVRAIDGGRSVAYLPGRWRAVMFVLRHLPDFLFHRLRI